MHLSLVDDRRTCYSRLCLVDDRWTFLHAFVPCRRSSAFLRAVCAFETIVGRFYMRLSLLDDRRTFYSRLCLVDDRWTFLHAFVPCRRSSAFLRAVCAFETIVGRFYMRLSLVDDRRTFLQPFVPCRRSLDVFTCVCAM